MLPFFFRQKCNHSEPDTHFRKVYGEYNISILARVTRALALIAMINGVSRYKSLLFAPETAEIQYFILGLYFLLLFEI